MSPLRFLRPALRAGAAVALVLLGAAVPRTARADDPAAALPRGEIVERVECLADPSQSYAVYLPSTHTPERRWPALLLLDARGRGAHAAERFRAAAERFGWVVLSSNDSTSDAGWEQIGRPAAALLADASRRFAIDPRRVHLGGFSGTARGAGAIAAAAGGEIVGVYLTGAGLPEELPVAGLPFALFAAAGSEDFNYPEVDALADPLAAAGVPHRVEFFDGPHAWPPAELAEEALGWFELRAMAAGTRPLDAALAAGLAGGWLSEAGERERGGDPVEALRLYRSTAADLADLLEVAGEPRALEPPQPGDADPSALPPSVPPPGGQTAAAPALDRLRALHAEAAAAAERLEASATLRRAAAERRRTADWEAERRRDLEIVIRPLRVLDDQPPLDTRRKGARLIAELQTEAAGEGPQALAARRVLALAAANAGFYLPRDLLGRGEYRRAEIALELAVLVRPDDTVAWYNLACARARLGRETEALDALERAIEAGWQDADHMAADPDLESLRGSERFDRLLERARESGG